MKNNRSTKTALARLERKIQDTDPRLKTRKIRPPGSMGGFPNPASKEFDIDKLLAYISLFGIQTSHVTTNPARLPKNKALALVKDHVAKRGISGDFRDPDVNHHDDLLSRLDEFIQKQLDAQTKIIESMSAKEDPRPPTRVPVIADAPANPPTPPKVLAMRQNGF
jgi:hypothetical protein